MVDVDGSSHLSADSQPKSVGLVWGLTATRRSVKIHQMNPVNSRSDHGHEDSTINIVIKLLLLLLLSKVPAYSPGAATMFDFVITYSGSTRLTGG